MMEQHVGTLAAPHKCKQRHASCANTASLTVNSKLATRLSASEHVTSSFNARTAKSFKQKHCYASGLMPPYQVCGREQTPTSV